MFSSPRAPPTPSDPSSYHSSVNPYACHPTLAEHNEFFSQQQQQQQQGRQQSSMYSPLAGRGGGGGVVGVGNEVLSGENAQEGSHTMAMETPNFDLTEILNSVSTSSFAN